MKSIEDASSETRPGESMGNAEGDRAAASRRRILDAALLEFSEHGWGGARVDRIAERAEINKRMLYAYIGNKQALWVAVLERVYTSMRAGERALNLTAVPPVEGMQMLVRFNFRFHAEHPEFLAMLNEENRQRARNLAQSASVPQMYSPLMAAINDLLERGVATGVFRTGIDPMQLYISIASLSYFYCSNRYTLSTIFERDLSSPHAMLVREQHAVDVIMGYLHL